jgi:hypothetical protein
MPLLVQITSVLPQNIHRFPHLIRLTQRLYCLRLRSKHSRYLPLLNPLRRLVLDNLKLCAEVDTCALLNQVKPFERTEDLDYSS